MDETQNEISTIAGHSYYRHWVEFHKKIWSGKVLERFIISSLKGPVAGVYIVM